MINIRRRRNRRHRRRIGRIMRRRTRGRRRIGRPRRRGGIVIRRHRIFATKKTRKRVRKKTTANTPKTKKTRNRIRRRIHE